ncbi:MAG: PD40 domain-containing protein [Chloroflexi bacterium]|nr:PD40 domain-containing protein [Chloroflexota bacterium]
MSLGHEGGTTSPGRPSLLAVLLALILSAAIVPAVPASAEEPPQTAQPAAENPVDPNPDRAASTDLEPAALAPSTPPDALTPGTYLVEVETGRTVPLGRSALVAWAPDSRTVAVADTGPDKGEGRLRLVSVPDGTEAIVPLAERGEVTGLRWSPDGLHLAFTLTRLGHDPGPSLSVVEDGGKTVRQLVRGSVGDFTWTPDSSGISAIVLEEAGGTIVTVDVASGDVRDTVLSPHDASCERGLAWSPDGSLLAFGGPGLQEPCGDAGNWGIWTWNPVTRAARQLFAGQADAPQWLATGDLVAMVSEPHAETVPPLTLLRFDPSGAANDEPRTLAADIPRMVPQPPRLVQVVGSTVLFSVSTCDVAEAWVWSPGRVESIRRTPEGAFSYRPAIAPDGRSLAWVRVDEEASALVVGSLLDEQPRVVLEHQTGLQVGTAGPWDTAGDWSPDGAWIAVEVGPEQLRDCAS